MTTNKTDFIVPVFPHVKCFIKKKYKIAASLVDVEEATTLGRLITLSLVKKEKDEVKYSSRLTETVTIRLSSHQARYAPRIHKLISINNYVDQLFKDHLLEWIEGQRLQGTPPFAACRSFLQHYKLDEKDYSLDNAYKFWQRINK